MKNSFFLMLLVADFALGQKIQVLPPPKALFLGSQTGVLMKPEFIPGKNVSGNKDLPGWSRSRTDEMTLAMQGRFSHKTTNGSSIFIIPQDHMPCSVPGKLSVEEMSTKIPGNFESGDPMPNPLPKVQIIPPGKNPH